MRLLVETSGRHPSTVLVLRRLVVARRCALIACFSMLIVTTL